MDSIATNEVPAPRVLPSLHTAVRGPATATVAQLSEFDEIIDVRSEDEFAEDHIPGAINCPVLDNVQRAQVGTLHKQTSAFEAKKVGAALVSINIARHLEERFHDRPRTWRPLIYCWRGGNRSGALAHVLHQIGWRAAQLEGGYKSYRRAVVADLVTLPLKFSWRVICGLTGTGKSRLLRALMARGAQVLDLEALAAHRGSVLGDLPDAPQPSQKMFDSLVWDELRKFSPKQPVFVEAESKKIGNLRVPETLIAAMWQSQSIRLEAPVPVRTALLKDEYEHFLNNPAVLIEKLECLTALYGHSTIAHWKKLALARQWEALIEELLINHYDPAYTRSTLKHYPALAHAPTLKLASADETCFSELAEQCLSHAC
ncbi:MAG: tRNA 2-selenouridine(34) synthase MnmH [Burkholderiales bacterium]|nr:tRNA 2-selenouridine(34) synthase MnmH [Burkholderiales bacterium]